MIATIVRLFGVGHGSRPWPRKQPSIEDLVAIRQALFNAVLDCDSATTCAAATVEPLCATALNISSWRKVICSIRRTSFPGRFYKKYLLYKYN